MRSFLRSLQQRSLVPDTPATLAARFGPDLVDALVREDVLITAPPASGYPCPERFGPDCPRRVIANPDDPATPWMAVCGRSSQRCATVHLRPEDLHQLTFSPEGFERLLRRLWRVDARPAADGSPVAPISRLGRAMWCGVERTIELALRPAEALFEDALDARKRASGATLVVIPSRAGLAPRLERAFAPSDHVAIVFLEDVLALEGGRVRLVSPAPSASTEPASTLFCRYQGHDGARPISADEYQFRCDRAAEVDLFVNAVKRAGGRQGGHPCARRALDGVSNAASKPWLTYREATALLAIATAPDPGAFLGELGLGDVDAARKVVEAARGKVDIRMGTTWRSIQAGVDPVRGKFFAWKPPSDLTYCLLFPF